MKEFIFETKLVIKSEDHQDAKERLEIFLRGGISSDSITAFTDPELVGVTDSVTPE